MTASAYALGSAGSPRIASNPACRAARSGSGVSARAKTLIRTDLARLVARSAKFREETRGAHARAEFPELDHELDQRHTVLEAGSEIPRFEAWD